jgi:3-hydroxymyristoyl/3-hydroxydecanoyl-(acyl carrier protein) dehydratase
MVRRFVRVVAFRKPEHRSGIIILSQGAENHETRQPHSEVFHMLEHEEIKKYLRQRYPILLVDRVLEMDDRCAIGVKNVTGTDSIMLGHFPGEPIYPGVMLIEAMSQLGGILMAFDERFHDSVRGYLAKIDKVKFLRFIRPGDQIVMRAEKMTSFGKMSRVSVEALVAEQRVAEGEITYCLE